ncbi:Eco57I restriction-modification methylase domain-containing protein [Parabacteroides distasonis]|uniref:Eco57I restriction-modification methylase domain-containing protein n=1 Tax=Bacteroidales TaxID=171549 RepID=UPI0026F2E6BE|nr:TaqI-like C-terminal specificity domain-containing protein [Phocaeicola plebeius]
MNQAYLKNILSVRFDFNIWKDLLVKIFPKVEIFTNVAKITDSHVKEGGHVGNIRLDDGRSLAIFHFEVIDNVLISRNRKSLRDIAAKYVDQGLIHGALVFYYSQNQDDYRLTFIAKQTYFNESGELVKKETAPKRYTFLLGPNEPCTTAASRLIELVNKKTYGSIYLTDVIDAFSVERLNKEFFAGYKAQYKKFADTLSDTKQHRDYVKKLLGRLVFLQFLQKKGWMGVPASNTKWEGGNKNYLNDLVDKYEGNDRLLSDVLELLFFKTLNEKRNGDIADSILGENIKIPYLNGGLFDKDRIDELDIDFPYTYFKELMEFFSQYNFTIDENDPDDSEVGIDPEMLGHIFENLLEDNKDKGAFYTPKEIVQYMCRQSVIQYLKTHESAEQYAEPIEQLINDGVVNPILQSKDISIRFTRLLKEIKVCDPAIGSGAFPMGILYVLYHAIHHLHSHAEPHGNFDSTNTKRDIIQNNIFGVDIEQGAVDIARLRFWLALVVDAEKPQPLPNLDYKIVCGNSLLNCYDINEPLDDVFKEYNVGCEENERMSLEKYKQMVAEYTNTSDHNTKERFKSTINDIKSVFRSELTDKERNKLTRLKKKINDLEAPTLFERIQEEIALLKKLKKQLKDLETEFDEIECNKLYDNAFEWRFEFPSLLDDNGNFMGFDLIIGNPPYLRIQGIRDVNPLYADELVNKYKAATGSFDLYAIFVERGLQLINSRGIVNFIMPMKWTNAAFGKGLRGLVAEHNAANKIINFGAYQVFNASTYTALQWFVPNSESLHYYELDHNLETNQELGQYLKSIDKESASEIPAKKFDKNTWVLTVGQTTKILKEIEKHSRCIGDIFDRIFCGLQTSKDDVYFLYECTEQNGLIVGESKQLKRCIKIERGLVKPLLKGEDVHRYDNIKTNRYVIFPYKIKDGKAVLYTENELFTLFPNGYAYLKECEEELRNREKGRLRNDDYWFRYIYPKNLVLFDNEKLVAPDISMGGNFAYDAQGKFYQTTTIYGYIKKSEVQESYKFWMALLNSRLCWWFLSNTGTVLANGFFRFKPDYIKPFPVPKSIPNGIVSVVENLVDYVSFIKSIDKPISELVSNKFILDFFERIIDGCMYELYFPQHMQEREIAIADSAINIIRPISHLSLGSDIQKTIWETFLEIKKTDNPIRDRLDLFALRSPEILKTIIEL